MNLKFILPDSLSCVGMQWSKCTAVGYEICTDHMYSWVLSSINTLMLHWPFPSVTSDKNISGLKQVANCQLLDDHATDHCLANLQWTTIQTYSISCNIEIESLW